MFLLSNNRLETFTQ